MNNKTLKEIQTEREESKKAMEKAMEKDKETNETLKKISPDGFIPLTKNFENIYKNYFTYEKIEDFIKFFNEDLEIRINYIDISFFTASLKKHKPSYYKDVKMELVSKTEKNKICKLVIITKKVKIYEEISFITGIHLVSVEENKGIYKKYLNGTITNAFTSINKKTPHLYDREGQQLLFSPEELGIESVSLDNTEEKGGEYSHNLSITSSKLLDIIQLTLTEILPLNAPDEELSKYLELNLDVSKYMEFTGKKDKNQAVKQIKEDLETLFRARAKGTIKRTVKKGKSYKTEYIPVDIRYIDLKPSEAIRQTVPIRLALSYVKYLSQYGQFMYYPEPVLIACKNNNVYYIGKKLTTHYNMNRTKANKDSISVDKLLKWTPDIPSLDEEKKRGRHYRAYCIEPLEKCLDELQRIGILKEWYFTNENKELLSDEQLSQLYTSYYEWKHLYLHFVLKDYPTYQKAITHNDNKETL